MSHLPEQPYEVPYREEEHGAGDDDGRDFIAGTGALDRGAWWGTKTQEKQTRREMLARDRARQRLGGFGFRA